MSDYDKLYDESLKDPASFWSRMAAKTLVWDEEFTKEKVLKDCDWSNGKIHWFDGKLNASGKPFLYMYSIILALLYVIVYYPPPPPPSSPPSPPHCIGSK